jgi:hypothetical protein
MSEDMVELPQRMLSNLIQLEKYIDEYCTITPSLQWCEEQLGDMQAVIEGFSMKVSKIVESQGTKDGLPSQIEERDANILKLSFEMRDYANEKYKLFQKLW